MKTTCIQNKTASEFLEKNEESLLENESINNLILGLTDSIIRNLRGSDNPLFFTILRDNTIVGQAIRTHGDKPVAISRMDESSQTELASTLADLNLDLSGIVGPKESCSILADIWCKLKNIESTIGMHQGIYELINVIKPDLDGGEMLVATEEHRSIVSSYTLGFINDCFPDEKEPVERANEMAERHIKNGTIYLWKNSNGEIVSMASKNRESKNAATVSLVYTPKELRGKGYASCIVAQLSEKLLADGKSKCNLFTDLKNPTSNSIYQKIGYRFLGESMHFNFK